MERLPFDAFHKTTALFEELDYHLAVPATLSGATQGELFVDDVFHPRSAMMRVHHRFYLAGDAGNAAFNQALNRLFIDEIYPQGRSSGSEAYTLYYGEGWQAAIEQSVLAGLDPVPGGRLYYEMDQPRVDWRVTTPEEFRLVEVSSKLLENPSLVHLDELREEMQSERSSVDEFLQHSFGVCLLSGETLATWCLSEYNLGDRCEVGIATLPEFQRRGLGTATGAAFVEAAQTRGMRRIGWHCWANNRPSAATAEKIGYRLVSEYPSYFALFDLTINLAVHGNIQLSQGHYDQALAWFERAIRRADAPGWVYLNAAGAAARLNQPGAAFGFLDQAVDRGMCTAASLQEMDHLDSLHELPRWRTLVASLEA